MEVANIEQVIKEKYARYLNIQQTLRAYQMLYDSQRQQLEEILLTVDALKSIQKKQIEKFEGYMSIGSGIFIYVSGILSKNVLMSIGSNIAVNVAIEDAIEELNSREKEIRNQINETQKIINELSLTARKLEQEIISMQKYIQKR